MSKVYSQFEHHERNFNIVFSTSVAAAISLLLGGFFTSTGFFNNSSTWVVFLVLVAAPVITFIATSGNSEFRTAYYKTWQDRTNGLIDQRKILEQFARKYNIDSWKSKLKSFEADGRWNFRADTSYMHYLTEQRDLLLSQVYQEYQNALTEQNKTIIDAKQALANAMIEVNNAKREETEAKELLNSAKSSGEIYKQRQYHESKAKETALKEMLKNSAEHQLKKDEQAKDKLHDDYHEVVYRITKIYYARYAKYTESAIKKINHVNGLRYTIVDMPDAESWINKPARKELW